MAETQNPSTTSGVDQKASVLVEEEAVAQATVVGSSVSEPREGGPSGAEVGTEEHRAIGSGEKVSRAAQMDEEGSRTIDCGGATPPECGGSVPIEALVGGGDAFGVVVEPYGAVGDPRATMESINIPISDITTPISSMHVDLDINAPLPEIEMNVGGVDVLIDPRATEEGAGSDVIFLDVATAILVREYPVSGDETSVSIPITIRQPGDVIMEDLGEMGDSSDEEMGDGMYHSGDVSGEGGQAEGVRAERAQTVGAGTERVETERA